MAERNVTFLIIARDFASRTLKNVGDSTDRAAQKLRNLEKLGIGPVATAGAALGPALLPVLAGATVGAIGLGTAFLGAGAAAGVFGAVTKSVFGEVLEASQKSEQLREKISLLAREQKVALAQGDTANAGKFEKARVKALIEYRARLQELPPDMRAAVMGMDDMRTSWEGFVATNRSPVLSLLARGMNLLAAVLPHLQPLFNVAATAAGQLMGVFERFVSSGGLDRLVAFLSARAGPAFTGFGNILLSLGAGIGYLLAPFARTSDGVIAGLDRMSLSFAGWARTSGAAGMERILGFAREQGPGAASALWSLAQSVGKIAEAAAPLAPVSAAIARSLGLIIDALPQPVLTFLIGAFIAWNVALQGARVATLLMSGAQKAMAVATWAMNSALLASPITWVVIGLVALAAGLIYAYKHSETFRRIVQGALRAVVAAGGAVLDFFRGVPGFFSGMWTTVSGAFTTATGWIGRKLDQLGGWFQALPGRVLGFLASLPGRYAALWKFVMERGAYWLGFGIGWLIRQAMTLPGKIGSALAKLPGVVWGVITSAWNGARSRAAAGAAAVTSWFQGLPGRAQRAVSSLWSKISGAFTSARDGASRRAGELVTGAVRIISGLPGKIGSALRSVPGKVTGAFSGAGSWLISAGSDIIRGLVQGIGNMAGAAVAEAKRIAGNIVGGVKAGLGIGSPSRVMADEVGRWIPPGIMAGVESAVPGMLGRMGGVMDSLVGAADRPIVGEALLSAGGRPGMTQAGRPGAGGEAEMLQPIQLVLDGKVIHQALLRIKRNSGGVSLGLG